MSGNNSVVECDLAKVEVAGSNPVSRSKYPNRGYAEKIAVARYLAQGYDVISVGKPDLILLKDGHISFVEVKGLTVSNGKEITTTAQKKAIALLHKHHYKAEVVYEHLPPSPKDLLK